LSKKIEKLEKNPEEVKMKDKFEMVGKAIEEFSLPNSRGETITIKEFLGRKNILISLRRDLD